MLIPLFNYVLVKKDQVQEKSHGGILIADNSKEKPSTGIVIAVGEGLPATETGQIIPTGFKEGDHVVFPRFIGIDVEYENEKYYIIRSTDIMAKIEG